MNDHDTPPVRPEVTPEHVLQVVARWIGVTPDQIIGRSRRSHIARARSAAVFLIYELTPLSLMAIAEVLSGRDHTTIIYARDKCRANIARDPSWAATIDTIRREVLEGPR